MKKRSILLLIFLKLLGCSSNGKNAPDVADLDVSMSPSKSPIAIEKDGEELSYTRDTQKDLKTTFEKIPPTAVIDWQKFFKAPPTPNQRGILETKLQRWNDNKDADSMIEKGRAELALGQLTNAEASFRTAIRLKANHPDALLELASLDIRRKNWVAAFDLLAQIRESILNSDNTDQSYVFRYRYTLAVAYLGHGERDRGHKVLSDLIGIDKAFAPAYVALATSYLASGKDTIAEFVAKRGLDRTQNQAPLLNILGLVALQRKEIETARDWFERALALNPNYSQARVNRALISVRQLEYAAAEQDLLKALTQEPNNVDALIILGIVQRKQGNFSGAKASLAKATDLDPDNPFARFNLAVLTADNLKKPNEAVRLFSEVLQTLGSSNELKQIARSYLDGLKPGTLEY